MEFVTDLLVGAVSSPFALLVVFAVCMLDAFFPPVPSDIVLVAAVAVAVGSGPALLVPLIVVAALGAMIGDNIVFELGRRIGTTRYRWMRSRPMRAAIASAEHQLLARPASLIITGRYIPVGRIAVNLTAGSVGLPRRTFVPLSIMAGASWSLYMFAVALLASAWIQDNPLLSALIAAASAVLLGLLVDRVMSRAARVARAKRDASGEAAGPVATPDIVAVGAPL
ncbi:DedA family protein [Agreia sp. Leaf244]|uniref:DedA family protein n=1 Tax=Agreia sp. Leaf244 TaxID=1736305 RepID=UPI0009EA9D5D|nr:VTT domain-containing protein [Agreia sp. Leaf244]